jgi:hypothetical protein
VSMAPATCLSQVLVFAVFAPFAHAGELTGPNLGGFRRQPEPDMPLGAGDDHAAVAVALAVGLARPASAKN